jgi:predicted ArsR family transcriptional regulator
MLTQSVENARCTIVAALEADARRTNADIASSLGVHRAQVATIRTTLECIGAIPSHSGVTGPPASPALYLLKPFAAVLRAFRSGSTKLT